MGEAPHCISYRGDPCIVSYEIIYTPVFAKNVSKYYLKVF
jgi:hypothetical protein